MLDADIPTYIDRKVAIAHDKLIIVDGHTTVGGSLNYSSHALKNAENVTVIHDPDLAGVYAAHIFRRLAVSVPYERGKFCKVK